MKNPGHKQVFLEKLVSTTDNAFFPLRLIDAPDEEGSVGGVAKSFDLGFLEKRPLDLMILTFQ